MQITKITYRNFKEDVEGIDDIHSRYGLVARDLCRQILDKHDYIHSKAPNFENNPCFYDIFEYDSVYGADDLIYNNQIPEDDPLKFIQTKHKFGASSYLIDYKSNNFQDNDSIYVKLITKYSNKAYLDSNNRNGKIYDPILHNIERDYNKWKKALENGENTIKNSHMKRCYGNNQILSVNYKADFVFFVKYLKPGDISKCSLESAYLVPLDKLKKQVAGILNGLLKEEDYSLITLQKDFYLNHKICKAFDIHKKNHKLIHRQMELFRTQGNNIILRIPEHLIVEHIKFNEYGEIG